MVMSHQADTTATGLIHAGDLGPLAWVMDATRKSIESATKSLKRYAHELESARGIDLAAVDATPLRGARQQLHQVVGALEMVDQSVAAQMVRAMESAVQQLMLHPEKCDEPSAQELQRGGFALMDYLECQLRGQPRSALGLFPQFRRIQELAGADRIHPADLWPLAWRWTDPPTAAAVKRLTYGPEVRGRLDRQILRIMKRGDVNAASEISGISLGLADGQSALHTVVFWKLSAGFFEALAKGLLPLDVYAKRAASRVLLQYSALARGDEFMSERLARDLLFFCAQAQPAPSERAPVLHAVRSAWGLQHCAPVDYNQPMFGLYDPAVLAQARRRVEAVKENWSALAGGDVGRIKAVSDQFALLNASLNKLHANAKPLAEALTRVAQQSAQSNHSPSPELAMETATAVLFLEASFADFQPADATFTHRMNQLAERLDAVRDGGSAPELEPWMEELYRSASDRQTMGTVVGELRATLNEVEQYLDQYFRNPADKGLLVNVPGLMVQIRGVLSVLGLDQAVLVVGRMREMVDELLDSAEEPEQTKANGTFERLGNNLGALGFLVDMLGYQPVLARKLFVYDAETGELKHLVGRGRTQPHQARTAVDSDLDLLARLDSSTTGDTLIPAVDGASIDTMSSRLEEIAAAAALDDKPALASAAKRAAQAVRDGDTAELSGAMQAVRAAANPMPVALVEDAAAALGSTEDGDDNLQGIFLEEARDVVRTGQDAVRLLAQSPDDVEQLTTLRRVFHTLKGSSRMVGLTEFSDAGWAMEQLLNAWLAEQKPANDALRTLSTESLHAFHQWVEDIATKRDGHWSARAFTLAADALRIDGRLEPLGLGHLATTDATSDTTLSSAKEPGADGASPAVDQMEEVIAKAPVSDAVDAPKSAETPQPPQALSLATLDLPDLELGTSEMAVGQGGLAAVADADFPVSEALPGAVNDRWQDIDMFSGADVERVEAASIDEAPPQMLALDPDQLDFATADASDHDNAVAMPKTDDALALDLNDLDFATADFVASTSNVAASGSADIDSSSREGDRSDADAFKLVGDLRISTPLYNVYLNEADEWSRQLITELSEWALELHRPLPERAVALAHSLAGSSATVGFAALSELARAVEHALVRLCGQSHGTAEQARVLEDASEDIRRVLHQFAAGMLKAPNADVLSRVCALEPVVGERDPETVSATRPGALTPEAETAVTPPSSLLRVPTNAAASTAAPATHGSIGDDIDVMDAVDPDLFPIFEEEAEDLLPRLSAAMRQWIAQPDERDARSQVLRALHTLKGSARLAGALRLGEMAHRTESAIETIGTESLGAADLEPILEHVDELQAAVKRLQIGDVGVEGNIHAAATAVPAYLRAAATPADLPVPAPGEEEHVAASAADAEPRSQVALPAPLSLVSARVAASQAVRVRSQLLDRLVAQAGELVTSRGRLEAEIGHLRLALTELTGNLERLRTQLRDVELQAEMQMQSRIALAKDSQQNFDPLEFDRFTRMQELTRMMAESVNDVATVQRSLQRAIESSEDDLVAQARQSRELQRDLLRTRMVEFEGVAERLYRVVRQASKETGKQVRLDITGGSIEMDRGILDRMTPAFEHLLRNCVVHGIENQAVRTARSKDPAGLITIEVHQAGNDVSVEFRDDGGGLNLPRIRERALQMGVITEGQSLSDAEIGNLIFAPGFSTATEVTELAGRGVGMDVVRTEVLALGGRIETQTREGQGTAFRIVLPLTTAVTHVVMVRAGSLAVGVPSNLIETVQRATTQELQQAYADGTYRFRDETLPFFWLGALLQNSVRSVEPLARTSPVVIFRSATQRVAVHVDEVLGNHEVVVKALGPQLSRLPGLVAITALASGAVALIYNPVALGSVYGERARAVGVAPLADPDRASANKAAAVGVPVALPAVAPSDIPLVLVVDDSITVRRVTQRLLQREGYRVAIAADGLQGLEKLKSERPAVVLSDIEMPRMDGFDFVRNIRADDKLVDLPVIMITSRTAEKHREHARELGVNHYLGKPYSEDQLLRLVADYARAGAQPVAVQ